MFVLSFLGSPALSPSIPPGPVNLWGPVMPETP